MSERWVVRCTAEGCVRCKRGRHYIGERSGGYRHVFPTKEIALQNIDVMSGWCPVRLVPKRKGPQIEGEVARWGDGVVFVLYGGDETAALTNAGFQVGDRVRITRLP